MQIIGNTAPKGISVGNSQAKGPKLDETLESQHDNEVVMTPKKQFPIWGRIFQVTGQRRT